MEAVMKKLERSVSRGREQGVMASSGRGGAGNIRSLSRDNASAASGGPAPDDYSQSRGRELPGVKSENQKVFTSGRGGAGNMRSPSRDAVIESRNALREEAKLVREHANALANADVPVSHGRGGAGNISNSRSRSRSRDPSVVGNGSVAVHSSGRGGYGNFKADESSTTLGRLAEEEDRKVVEERHEREKKEGQIHSTGRGGFANLFHRTSTSDDHSTREKSITRTQAEFISSGRGGAGNIVHS